MSNDFVIVSWGGIGDCLVCTPTYRALKEKYPDRKIILYCVYKHQQAVFENNPYIDSVRFLGVKSLLRHPLHLYAYLFRRSMVKYHRMAFQNIPPPWLYRKSVKEIIPEIFNIPPVYKDVELYFTAKEEQQARERLAPYKNVVFMHIYSKSSENHHWDIKNWVRLVSELPQYTFIQLGSGQEPYVKGAIDWRGKTGLREAFCLLKYCTSFVGVDSGFSHVTNAFKLPGVVLFGDSSPVYWGHENNINIYKNLPCSPCYYYAWGYPCSYGHECMKMIAVEEVKQALIQQVNSRQSILAGDRHSNYSIPA